MTLTVTVIAAKNIQSRSSEYCGFFILRAEGEQLLKAIIDIDK